MTTTILLYGAGIALIVAEIFIPSLGFLGMAAALCLLGSIAMAFAEDPTTGAVLLGITAILVPVMMTFGIKLFPKTPIGKRMTVRGYSFEDGAGTDRRDADLVGATGTVESVLRPAGMARIDGRRVDVVSRGEVIEAGTAIVVVETSGNRVVVARADAASA